jgi:hypothetical protein
MLAGDVRRSGNDCATSGPREVGEIEKHPGAVLALRVRGAAALLEDSILCERAITGRNAANRRGIAFGRPPWSWMPSGRRGLRIPNNGTNCVEGTLAAGIVPPLRPLQGKGRCLPQLRSFFAGPLS